MMWRGNSHAQKAREMKRSVSKKDSYTFLLPTPHYDSEPAVVSKRANDQVIIKIGRPIC